VIEALPAKIKAIIEAHEPVTFERGHFTGFGESSLDFEFVYFVNATEYLKFMDIQQSINLAILRLIEAEGISIAYPTRTVYAPAPHQATTIAD
jgi:small-conductance mechanosensitive channel